jgi:hypothetical protein
MDHGRPEVFPDGARRRWPHGNGHCGRCWIGCYSMGIGYGCRRSSYKENVPYFVGLWLRAQRLQHSTNQSAILSKRITSGSALALEHPMSFRLCASMWLSKKMRASKKMHEGGFEPEWHWTCNHKSGSRLFVCSCVVPS